MLGGHHPKQLGLVVFVPLAAVVNVVAVLAMFNITNVNLKRERIHQFRLIQSLDWGIFGTKGCFSLIQLNQYIVCTGSGADKVPL